MTTGPHILSRDWGLYFPLGKMCLQDSLCPFFFNIIIIFVCRPYVGTVDLGPISKFNYHFIIGVAPPLFFFFCYIALV